MVMFRVELELCAPARRLTERLRLGPTRQEPEQSERRLR